MNYDNQFKPNTPSLDFSGLLKNAPKTTDPKEAERKKTIAAATEGQSDLQTYHYDKEVQDYLGKEFKPAFGNMLDKYNRMKIEEQDRLAEQQSWYGNSLRFLGNAGTTLLREVGKLPGYLGGMVMSWHPDITIGEAMDNSWNKFFDGLDEDIKNSDLFKTYVPSNVQNGSVFDKLTSGSYWATTGADAVGNLLSFFVPGAVLRSVGVGGKLAKGLGVTKLIKDEVKLGKFLKNADDFTGALFSASIESSMEAHESYKGIYAQLKPKVDAGELTEEEAKKIAGDQAAKVFSTNMLLLSASNMIDSKWLFGSFKGESYMTKKINNAIKEEIVKPAGKKWYNAIPSTVGIVGKGFVKEGFFEEGAQFATQKYFENQALGKNEDPNWFTGIVGEYYDGMMNSDEFWESVALGGILGSPLALMGARNERKFEKEFLYGRKAHKPNAVQRLLGKREQESSEGILKVLKDNYMNNFNEKTDFFERDENGNIKLDKNNKPIEIPGKRLQTILDLMSQDVLKMDMVFAKATGNELLFESKKQEALYNFFRPYFKLEGGREVFKAHLNDIAEKEQKNLLEFGENKTIEDVKSDLMNKFVTYQNQFLRTSDSMKTINKLSKEQKTQTPEFDALLTNVMMLHYLDQKTYKDAISKLDSEIAELEGSELVLNQKLAEPLKKRKTKIEEALKKSEEDVVKYLTKEGQQELFDRYNKRQKDNASAVKNAENDTTVMEEASNITNISHADIYEKGTIIDPVTNKKYHGGVTITNEEDGKSYQADIVGLENGELKVKDKSGKEFTIKADGTINGKKVTVANSYPPKIPRATNLSVEPTSPVRSVITEQKRNENKEKILAFINKLTNDRKGISNDITQLENTIAYLDSLLEDTRNLSEKEINAIAKEINTLLSLIKSSTSKNTKYGENVNKKLQLLKDNFRSQFTLLNDITDRVRVLKETLNQLSQIEQDLTKQIDYYNNLIANKSFETLSQTELLEQIETIKKKRSVIEKLISIITNAISKTTKAISEIFSMFQSRNRKLEGFIKRNNFKVLSPTELKKAIEEGTADNYAELKAEYDKLEKEVLSILDEGDFLDNISKEERTKLEELQNTLSKYDNQLRYLKELILATTPSALNKKEITVKKQIDRTRTTPEVKKAEVNNQQNNAPASVVETTPAPVIVTTVVDTTKIPVNVIEPEDVNQEEAYDSTKRNFKDEPHAPFTGSIMDFFRTKGTQVEYEKNPEKYKSYLEFLKFIDLYDPFTSEEVVLKAFTINTLPKSITDKLPKELLKEYKEYPSSIILVAYKGNTPVIQNSSYLLQLLSEPLFHGDVETVDRESRYPLFSYEQYRKQMPGLSDDIITADVQKMAESFESFRQRIIKSSEPVVFKITGRNSGVLLLDQNMEPTTVVGKIIPVKEKINEISLEISKNDANKGIVVINHAGNQIPVFREKLSKKDISRTVDLMKFYVNATNEVDREKAHKGLQTILHIVYQSKGQKAPNKYTFYPVKNEKKEVIGFQYGEWKITKEELNENKTQHLIGKFLSEKIYSVDKVSLEEANKGFEFTTYEIVEGEIEAKNYKNYKEYLFGGETPRLKVKLKPLGDTQFINRTFNIEPVNMPAPSMTTEEIKIVKEDIKTPITETDDFTPEITDADIKQAEEFEKQLNPNNKDNYNSPDFDNLYKIYKPSDITGVTPEAIKAFKKKFPGFDLRFISNGLINGIGVAAVTKNMEILVTNYAVDGDLNHEAFHIVSQFFMSEKTRNKLYIETKNRLGKPEMSDLEAEEFLADEFQMYMEDPSKYKFNKGEEIKQTFFQRLWKALKSLFGVQTVEEMFEEIASSKYEKTEAINKPSDFSHLYKIKRLDNATTMRMVKHYNVLFFDILFFDKGFNKSIINLTEEDINKVYSKLKDLLSSSSRIENKVIYERINEVENEHKKFLNQYGFQLEYERPENEQYIESNKISQLVTMPTPVKLLIAGLAKRDRGVNYGVIEKSPEGNFASTVDFESVLNLLNRELANLPQELIFPKLAQLYNEKKHPELKSLLDRLGVLLDSKVHTEENKLIISNTISPKITPAQLHLQTMFLNEFTQKADNPLMMVTSRENPVVIMEQSADTMQEKILADWKANLRGSGNSYFTFENGKYVLDKTALYKLPNGIKVPVLDIYKQGDAEKLFKRFKDVADYLAVFGITISDTGLNENKAELQQIMNTALDLIRFLPKNLDALEKPTLDDIFNKETGKVNKELKALAAIELKYSRKNLGNQYLNGKGQTENSISLPNRLSHIINEVKYNLEDNYIPYAPGRGDGNLQTFHHSWNYENLRLSLLRSIKADFEDARDVDNSNKGDFHVLEINAVLSGINPFLRAADRGLEYGIQSPIPNSVFKMSDKDIVKAFIPYLKNEIMIALAYQNDPIAKHFVKTRETAKELQFFKDILPSLKVTATATPSEYAKIADDIIKDEKNFGYIVSTLTKYIQKQTEENLKIFIDWRLVDKVNDKYVVNGLSSEIVNKVSTEKDLDFQSLEQLARTFSFLYIRSGLDQMKHIMGNLSTYNKGESTELHKRTTLAVATKQASRNDQNFIDVLNTQHKRADLTEHTRVQKNWTIQDVSVYSTEAEMLKKLGIDEYSKKMKENDAEGWSSLDGYKALMIRSKEGWSEGKEMGYQYEIQSLIYNELYGKHPKFPKKVVDEFFKQHLPEGWKGIPMFNGVPIDIKKIIALTPVKPQGVGIIQNSGLKTFGQVSHTKTSVAPLLYSNVKDTKLKDLLVEMVINGIDFIFPESAKKGEMVGNAEGKLPSLYNEKGEINSITEGLKQGFQVENLFWHDMGIQLDIDPSGHDKVTLSTQQESLKYLNVFDKGISVEERSDLVEIAERDNRLKSIRKDKLFKDLVNDLGLLKVNNKWTIQYPEKFAEVMKGEFSRKNYSLNTLEGILQVINSEEKNFDTINVTDKVDNLLNSLINNNLIKQKVNGDMLIQQAVTGYETSTRDTTKSNFLKTYIPEFDNEGNIIKVNPAECIIPLPKKWINLVEKEEGKTFVDKLNNFNKKIQNKSWDKLLTFSSNRTPAQDLNSMEVMRIKKFLVPWSGSTIIVPSEIVVKAGSDFDVDKLNSYLNASRFDEEGNPVYLDEGTVDLRYEEYILSTLKKLKRTDVSVYKETLETIDEDVRQELIYLKNKNKTWDNVSEQELKESLKSYKFDLIIHDFNLLSFEDFQMLPVEEQYSIEQLDNIINQNTIKFVLHPANYKILMSPNGSDVVNNAVDKATKDNSMVNKPKSKNRDLHTFLHYKTNMEYGFAQWKAMAVLGSAANNTTFHAKVQRAPITINEELIMLPFDGVQSMFGAVENIDGEFISKILGQYVSAAVDAAKETYPALTKGNITPATANIAMMLTALGVKPETIIKLLTHKDVLTYENAREIEEAKFLQVQDKQKYRSSIIEENTGYDQKAQKQMMHNIFKGIMEGEEGYTKEKLQERFNNKFSKGVFTSDVLEYFLYLTEVGKMYGELIAYTKHDTSMPKNRDAVAYREEKLQKLIKTGIFSGIEKFFENTHVGKFREMQLKGTELFDQMFTRTSDERFAYYLQKVMQPYKDAKIKEDVIISIQRKLTKKGIAYLLHNSEAYNIKDKYAELLKGKNSIAKRLLKIKNSDNPIRHNAFIQELVPVIEEYIDRRKQNLEFDYIRRFSTKISTYEEDNLADSFKELIENTDPEIRQFATDVVYASIIQSGLNKSTNAFFDTIPIEYFYPIASTALIAYKQSPVNLLGEEAIYTIYQNSWMDKDIVKRQSAFIKGEFIANSDKSAFYIGEKNPNANYRFLSMEFKKEDGSKEIFLYEKGGLVDRSEPEDQFSKMRVEYNRIEKKGEANKFSEFTTPAIPSMLKTNNIKDSIKTTTENVNQEVEDEEFEKPSIDMYTETNEFRSTQLSTTVKETAETIYSKLGNKTKSENVVIKSWGELKYVTEAITSENIVSTRIKNSNEHFGNPYSHDPAGKTQGLIKTESIKEAVEKYIEWVINSTDSRAQWIREQLKSDKLKNKPILYYKELGEPSHATALDYLINKYNWGKPTQSSTSVGNFNKKNLFTVTPIQSVDKKAITKASIASKYIGFAEGIDGSSTALYAKQISEQSKNSTIEFQEEQSSGYIERTRKNASADATIDFGLNQTGESWTKKAVENNKKKYIGINTNNLTITTEMINNIVENLNSVNTKTLNIAGMGIYNMKNNTQEEIDKFVYDLLKKVVESPNLKTKIESIRTGGQTGFDESGAKAGLKLGIKTIVLAPKGWVFRNQEGKDISNKQAFENRFSQSNVVNSGNYSPNDVVFVSVVGKRGNEVIRKQQQDKTIREAIKAIEAGATILTDNKAYIDSNPYNTGEQRLYANMEAKGYNYSEITVDGQVIGTWSKTQPQTTKVATTKPNIPIQIKKDAKSNWNLELTFDGKVINTNTGKEVDEKTKLKALTKYAFQAGFGTKFNYNNTEYAAIITNTHNTSLSEFKIVSLSESNMGGEVFKQGTPQFNKIVEDNNNVVELLQKICSL